MTTTDEDDPTPAETTGQGYPEENQPGTGIDAREHAEDDVADDDDAPSNHPQGDGDAGQATGNPRAAGSDDDQ